MKTIGYLIFAFVYFICKPIPIKKKRVLCIATHDEGDASNVNLVVKALKKENQGYTFSFITKSHTNAVKKLNNVKLLLSFFFLKPYEMARAEYILLDNVFLPYAYLHRKQNAKVIQLWHGTGTIKKFGQDVNEGKLKQLEKRANKNITHLIVNSEGMQEQYAKAFGVPLQKVYPLGLPKTDELLQRLMEEKERGQGIDKEYIYQKYKIPQNKKLILYAPTFRDDEVLNPKAMRHVNEIMNNLPQEYYLGLRLHPYVAHNFQESSIIERVCQLSFETDLNTLLMASDLLITDYSSIIFDYCLTEKPMIFFAYDLAKFSNQGRGFYEVYETMVPGPVVSTGSEVAKVVKEYQFDRELIVGFKNNVYSNLDGKATERIINILK